MTKVGTARRLAVCFTLMAALLLAGCGQKVGQGATDGEQNIQALAKLLTRHRQSHSGQLPKSDAEFKKFVDGLKQSELDDMKVTDKAKVFISPRDNQPYVIVYPTGTGRPAPPRNEAEGKKSGMATTGGILAYEKTGVGGKRFIVREAGGSVSEITEEEFKRLMPNAQ